MLPSEEPEPSRKILPEEEFRAALERVLPGLRVQVNRIAGRMLLQRESLSDIVQSTVRDALGARDHFEWRGEAAFRAYIYVVATRKVLQKARYHAGRERVMQADESGEESDAPRELPERADTDRHSPAAAAQLAEDLDRLQTALDELGDEERAMVTLVHMAQMTVADVARELEIPESSARYKLAKAWTRLVAKLGSDPR